MDYSSILVIVPVYNEAPVLAGVLDSLLSKGFANILVVDDGSVDSSAEIARGKGANVIHHTINLGLGGALKTGRSWVSKYGQKYSYVATFDGDGQHSVGSLIKLLKCSRSNPADVFIGARSFDRENSPLSRILINKLASIFTWFLCGRFLKDTQSGLRLFKHNVFTSLNFSIVGYGVSSEILFEVVKRGFSIAEVDVPAKYTDYSLNKGQNVHGWYKVVFSLLRLS